RKKHGQFYTRVEVVDLINSFAIRTGEEKVMDPACGGGTFLVRAYARKRELAHGRRHAQLLSDLYGVDVSPFATQLTTINLATRELIAEENYPQIARSDFFDVDPHKTFLSLPRPIKAAGLGPAQQRAVEIPQLDAMIANPPYVRQEDIPKAKAKSARDARPPRATKEFYQWLIKKEDGGELSGRSDLHCYFWPHAASMLKDDGWLCFLTSSQWLDVEYGFRLQGWLLANFEIAAVFESIDEPWFIGARVATAVTILRKQRDEKKRMENVVRFVQLRRPMREILAHDGTTVGAMNAADSFRDEVLALTENVSNQRYRARLVPQADLWREGVKLGAIIKGTTPDDSKDKAATQTGEYYGGKWGVYLRAPDLWFDLLEKYGGRFAPLGALAEIRFGVKSGKDSFFFPRDCSADCLTRIADAAGFEREYGVPRKDIELGRVKLVLCGEERGEIRPLESKYLEPEVHSLMEIDGFTVAPEDCARMILLVNKKKSALKGTYALKYLEWGGEAEHPQVGNLRRAHHGRPRMVRPDRPSPRPCTLAQGKAISAYRSCQSEPSDRKLSTLRNIPARCHG
ncbi:MAG: N-6 DNA methylase, partial [Burkholderiales bacterium]|nr:N-6 DNA methylase [Burkholderiales bacterium]